MYCEALQWSLGLSGRWSLRQKHGLLVRNSHLTILKKWKSWLFDSLECRFIHGKYCMCIPRSQLLLCFITFLSHLSREVRQISMASQTLSDLTAILLGILILVSRLGSGVGRSTFNFEFPYSHNNLDTTEACDRHHVEFVLLLTYSICYLVCR